MQDLKTGHLLKASPKAQFFGQMVGSFFSVVFAVAAFETGSRSVSAPILAGVLRAALVIAGGAGRILCRHHGKRRRVGIAALSFVDQENDNDGYAERQPHIWMPAIATFHRQPRCLSGVSQDGIFLTLIRRCLSDAAGWRKLAEG